MKKSETIYSKACGFLHSLNNHLLVSAAHQAPGLLQWTPTQLVSGIVRVHPRTALLQGTRLVPTPCSFSQNSSGGSDREAYPLAEAPEV